LQFASFALFSDIKNDNERKKTIAANSAYQKSLFLRVNFLYLFPLKEPVTPESFSFPTRRSS
jgi:hypothetical protein